MGTVARIGIASGRRVPIEGLLGESRGTAPDALALKMLGRVGFARTAERLAAGEPLTIPEIERLMNEAPLSLLSKLLVMAGRVTLSIEPPRPLVFARIGIESTHDSSLELDYSLGDQQDVSASTTQQAGPDGVLTVALDAHGVKWFDSAVLKQVERFAVDFPEIEILGPKLDEISIEGKPRTAVRELLATLRDLGVKQLSFERWGRSVESAQKLGFELCWKPNLSNYGSSGALAREYDAARDRLASTPAVRAWMPVHDGTIPVRLARNIPGRAGGPARPPAPHDGMESILAAFGAPHDRSVLRFLAIGALLFPASVKSTAAAPYLSLPAIGLARWLGASSLGYAAADEASSRALDLPMHGALTAVMGRA